MDSDVRSLFFFDPPQSRYQVLPYFRQQWLKAFKNKGISCHHLNFPTKDHFLLLQKIKEAQPDFTIAINGLMPSNSGFFLSDYLKIPHLAILVDFPTTYYQLTQSSHTMIACPDEKACEFLLRGGFSRTFFLPHAVEKELFQQPSTKKTQEIVFFSSFIDPDKILYEWQNTYPESLVKLLKVSAEITLNDSKISFWEAFENNLAALLRQEPCFDLNQWNIFKLLNQLESYLRASDKLEMLKGLKSFNIHLYGEGAWASWCNAHPHITLHPPVDFTEALEIMAKSKVTLNSCPSFKYGSHERVFYAFGSHSLPLTSSNPFLSSYYQQGESILYYTPFAPGDSLDRLSYLLKDDDKREELIERGRIQTLKCHTWEHRVETIMEKMSSFLAPRP